MPRYNGPIVDTDLHHNWKTAGEVLEYLSAEWREYAHETTPRGPRIGIVNANIPGGSNRLDGRRLPQEPECSDLTYVSDQLLDRHNFYRCVLTFDVGGHGNVQNPYFGTAYACASNEWNIDTWLTWDQRFYGVVAICAALPEEAAAEIRRIGQHPRICATLFSGSPLGRPYGDPVYFPIWKASAEVGIPVDIHPGFSNAERDAGGKPLTNMQATPNNWSSAMHHVTSMIVHGVFEQWPTTKVLIKEHGTVWLPYLASRLDSCYETLKLESKWVRRWPSDYIREHVRVGTQPLEEPIDPKMLKTLYESEDMENLLCFATDYAHSSFDDPGSVIRRLPSGWARAVMCDNACAYYGWEAPPSVETRRDSVATART